MSNLKMLFHRIIHGSSHRTNDQLMSKLKRLPESQPAIFFDHPYVKSLNEKLEKFCQLIGKQCQVVGQHRARRTVQILSLYRNLYGAHTRSARELLRKLADILRLKNADGKRLFLLSAVIFDWRKESISDEAFLRTKNEMKTFIDLHAKSAASKVEDSDGEVWEKVVDTDVFKLWRCPVSGSSLYKYKVFGTYKDLPASTFYKVQMDIEYRKKWDKYVIKLEKVDRDEDTGSEVIYWATHFPLNFLSCRDYLYVRRCEVDEKSNVMTISARAVQHPKYPSTDDYVRVDPYMSTMLIKPHTTFEEKGFDYVMHYYDDPKLYVPSWAVNKMTVSSLPTFVNTIHEAAMKMYQSKKEVDVRDQNSNNSCRTSVQSRLYDMGTAYAYNIETETNKSSG